MRKLLSDVVFIVAMSILLANGLADDCERFQGDRIEDTTCPTGWHEVYREEGLAFKYTRLCCVSGSQYDKVETRRALTCRATKCVSSTRDTLCTKRNIGEGDRYINGKKIRYEEIMRDPCTREGDGGHGVVGVCCQVNSAEGLLVTSTGAEHNEFPHMAKLPGCGGTVYNKRFILTASHCIVDKKGNVNNVTGLNVVLGTNIAKMDVQAKEYVYEVKRIIPHEQYSSLASYDKNELNLPEEDQRVYNDVALLELKRDIVFSDKIKSLEIAPANFDPYAYADNVIIAGWGTTELLETSIYLQKFNLILRRDDRCLSKYPDMEGFEKQILCVGGVMDGHYSGTAGGGDSGGPAICRGKDGRPVLCGVTSFGGDSDEDCAKYNDEDSCPPSVYAEIAYFREWIQKHAGQQDPTTFYKPYLYGEEVSALKYPHQVHITSSTGKSCGGTLIKPNFVVTAGQCVMKDDGKTTHTNLEVTTGLKDVTGKGNTFKVGDVQLLGNFKKEGKPFKLKHSKSVMATDSFYHNDLAIIKLEKSTSTKQDNLPKLPRHRDRYDHGTELAYPRNTTRSSQMMAREFKLLEKSECKKRMNRINGYTGRKITVDANLVCGVEKYSGGSTCDRELGGGLICKGADGKDVLCGVQTFRLCMLSVPNGFIDITQYGKWLEDTMEKMT